MASANSALGLKTAVLRCRVSRPIQDENLVESRVADQHMTRVMIQRSGRVRVSSDAGASFVREDGWVQNEGCGVSALEWLD